MSILTTSLLFFSLALHSLRAASLKQTIHANPHETEEKFDRFRTSSDDSFRQFDDGRVVGEHIIEVPFPCSEDSENLEHLSPLTEETLFQLSLKTQFPNSSSSSKTNVEELLHIKRTSSLKSLALESDDSTIKWHGPRAKTLSKASSFNALFNLSLPIYEAPTESVSTTTATTSSAATSLPPAFKQIFEKSAFSNEISSYLDVKDLRSLASTNKILRKMLSNHEMETFSELFPALHGISDSPVALRIFGTILQDENLEFTEWCQRNHLHPLASINLASFINSRMESATKSNERFALANLIEFLRHSGWHEYFFSSLPGPLKVFFTEDAPISMEVFKEKALSMVMKAAHYGHLRLLKALKEDIVSFFPKTIWPQLILDLFLLGTETRKKISWTALHRSVHAPNTQVANYLLNVLTSDAAVLETFHKQLKSRNDPSLADLPSFMEKLIFPYMSQQKLKRLLQRHMLLAMAVENIRVIHLSVMKSSNPDILRFFLVCEREFIQNPIDQVDLNVLLQLAFNSKLVHSVKLLQKESRFTRVPLEFAIKSDWPRGLKEYDLVRESILRFNNIFHLIVRHDAVDMLTFFKNELLSPEEFTSLSEQVDGNLKRPVDLALDQGKWEILSILLRGNPKQVSQKLLFKILEANAPLLDDFLRDQHERECFASTCISKTNHVTLFEWSILSGNQQALQWFLHRLPQKFLRRFDGAGNTPIHLAVLVGNSEALRRLLDLDSTLINLPNFHGETPSTLAHRIRDKTGTCNKIFLIDQIIQILTDRTIK